VPVTFIEAYKRVRKEFPRIINKETIWQVMFELDIGVYKKIGKPWINDTLWIKTKYGVAPKKKKFVITVNEVFINNFYDIRDYHLLEYLNKTQPDCEWFGCVIKPKEEND
jgi:hypothetical protein